MHMVDLWTTQVWMAQVNLRLDFFFFSCEKLYCFHWIDGLGEAKVVKKLPAGGASGRSPGIEGDARGPLKAC